MTRTCTTARYSWYNRLPMRPLFSRAALVTIPFVVAACASSAAPLAKTDPAALLTTLTDLAAFGNKRAGSPEGAQAAAYLHDRFQKLGLLGVHDESFGIPRWTLTSAAVSISIGSTVSTPPFEVFEASGSGHAKGALIRVHAAREADVATLDLTGKIALVDRDPTYHRSAQYKNVIAKGATAMLYVSTAPTNLRQVGSVRDAWESAGTIPAISIGADDGVAIESALDANATVTASIDVVASSTPAVGSNVVGRIVGESPEQIVIGAHYDTWFAGSTDNGGGVAALLALAGRCLQRGKPRYTLTFVAYDGEELALYGGYDFLHRHRVLAKEPILAVLNFETPSTLSASLLGLGHSGQPILDHALESAGLANLYPLYVGLDVVASLFGGIIPTDIQGAYRTGLATASTAVDGPYYHTAEDTPDKVDLSLLASTTDAFDHALVSLLMADPSSFAAPDPALWHAEVTALGTGAGTIGVSATVTDGNGVAAVGTTVHAAVLVDDFTLATTLSGITDGSGHVMLGIPIAASIAGTANRFLHFTAGPTYPLVEQIVAIPH